MTCRDSWAPGVVQLGSKEGEFTINYYSDGSWSLWLDLKHTDKLEV